MARRYAEDTQVTTERSRAEVERLIRRYGADQFIAGWGTPDDMASQVAFVQFRARGRFIRFTLPMPEPDDEAFTVTETGRPRSEAAAYKAWEQASRSRWRALVLYIKAKLEAVEIGLVSFEEAFLPETVLPDRRTVAQWVGPQLAAAYETGRMPVDALPALGPGPTENSQ